MQLAVGWGLRPRSRSAGWPGWVTLPSSAANITMFRPSSFFIVVHTGLGLQLQVQLVPLMQVFLRLDPAHRGQMCGEARGAWGRGQTQGLQAGAGG